jgi:4'-phosphopantetheinyl transferase
MQAGEEGRAGAEGISPAPGEIHVWQVSLDRVDAEPARLAPEERRRAAEIRRPGARKSWIAARWALRRILAGYLGVRKPEDVSLKIGENGKPALAFPSSSPLRFNLSHSGALSLVAIAADREVGIDLEAIEEGRDVLALARHGLEPEEAAAVAAAPPEQRSAAFHRAWVRREALAKCFGSGLAAPPPSGPATTFELDAGPGYAAALAVAGQEAATVRLYTFEGSSSEGTAFASR